MITFIKTLTKSGTAISKLDTWFQSPPGTELTNRKQTVHNFIIVNVSNYKWNSNDPSAEQFKIHPSLLWHEPHPAFKIGSFCLRVVAFCQWHSHLEVVERFISKDFECLLLGKIYIYKCFDAKQKFRFCGAHDESDHSVNISIIFSVKNDVKNPNNSASDLIGTRSCRNFVPNCVTYKFVRWAVSCHIEHIQPTLTEKTWNISSWACYDILQIEANNNFFRIPTKFVTPTFLFHSYRVCDVHISLLKNCLPSCIFLVPYIVHASVFFWNVKSKVEIVIKHLFVFSGFVHFSTYKPVHFGWEHIGFHIPLCEVWWQ